MGNFTIRLLVPASFTTFPSEGIVLKSSFLLSCGVVILSLIFYNLVLSTKYFTVHFITCCIKFITILTLYVDEPIEYLIDLFIAFCPSH